MAGTVACSPHHFDRSLDEDAGVFCRMHHELGLLDDQHYELRVPEILAVFVPEILAG